jgi:hypothetical protein
LQNTDDRQHAANEAERQDQSPVLSFLVELEACGVGCQHDTVVVPPLEEPVCVEHIGLHATDSDGDGSIDRKQGNATVAAPASVSVRLRVHVA